MATERTLLQLKITLRYIRPPIWRRFVVDSSITLQQLHDVIQTVMGWSDDHLHSFTIRGVEYSSPPMMAAGFLMDDMPEKESERVRLDSLKLRPKEKFGYLYDFGDNWEHIITVEKVYPDTHETATPYCMAGARNCPPEDCGSTYGYEEIVELLRNPEESDDDERLEWLGDYDPEHFDVEEINAKLKPKKPRARAASSSAKKKAAGKKRGK